MSVTDGIFGFLAIMGMSWVIINILAKFFPDDPEL